MQALRIIHLGLASVTVLLAGITCIWGLIGRRKLQWGATDRGSMAYARIAVLMQTLVIGTAIFGGLLWLNGARPGDPLHVRVYGPFMVAAIIGAWGYRTDDANWNARVVAFSAFFVFLLGLRALFTS